MTDLVTWLRAQLDEEERIARAVPTNADVFDGTGIIVMPLHDGSTRSVTLPSHIARFIADHDPGRVLAEVDAKRRILDEHYCVRFTDTSLGIRDADVCAVCHAVLDEPSGWSGDWAFPNVQCAYPCLTVRLLALAYADRSGYREEWRP